jgi:uncharacterized protein YbaP (TraB family)
MAKNGKSLLWEITGKGLSKPSYFFGTMHLMCAEDAELTETVKSLIKGVDQIYLEVDMDNASELLTGILDLRSKTGKTLRAALEPNDYNRVKDFFEKYQPNVPFSVLELQPPLMISSSLFELLLPCERKNGVEIKIIDEAYKEKKETKGLETIAFQSSLFDSIPYEDQAKDLVKSIDSLEKNRKAMNEMIQVYKDQDIEKLYSLSTNDESSTSNYMDLLLYKRNRNWVGQFSTIGKDSSTLFAVGAGHLGGDKGVLQLLKQQGYTVRPLAN